MAIVRATSVVVWALVAGVACSTAAPGTGPGAPGRKQTKVDASTLRAGVGSLARGGDALLDLLDDDAWVRHHGVTDVMRGRETIARYWAELASAYPNLRIDAVDPVPMGDQAWMIEASIVDGSTGARGRVLMLVRAPRRKVVSVELFGDDARSLTPSPGPAASAPPVLSLQLVSGSSVDAQRLVDLLADARIETTQEPDVRLAARGGGASLAVVVLRGRDPHGVPVSLHAAVIEPEADAPRIYLNERESAVFDMGNMTRGHENLMQSELHSEKLWWGAWQGFCCEHGTRTRSCRLIDLPAAAQCRAVNRLAFVCRQAYHCTGPECYCCSSGLDAACELEDAPDPEAPPSKRPPAPTVWSPY